MYKNLFLLIMATIFSFTLSAQDSNGWQWAKRGGGPSSFASSSIYPYGFERIVDLAIDSNNNYYYLAEISGAHYSNLVSYDGQELHTYNSSDNDRDIYVFSTDNDGNFRWDKMIGAKYSDKAISINVDAQDNLYVSGTIPPPFSSGDSIHFDTDTVIPATDDPYEPSPRGKGAFLIKYDQDGDFQWLRQPEGLHPLIRDNHLIYGWMGKTVIEPNGRTHSLVFLPEGGNLNGQLPVEEGERQPAIVTYDGDGNLEGFITLDIQPLQGYYDYQLAYDPNLDQYYIGDTQRDSNDELSINGYGEESDNNKAFYLAAVDNEGEVLWYHEDHYGSEHSLGDIQLDEEGNIYFTGMFITPYGESLNSFAGYEFTMQEGEEQKSPFLIKLGSDGGLIWGTNSERYSRFSGQSIAIDGDDVYLGLGMLQNTWGDIEVPGPYNLGLVPDVTIVKFDTQTGEALDAMTTPEITSTNDQIMALGVDGNHDLVTGGFFGSSLFYDTNFAISNSGGPSDFFIAKYETDKEDNPCAAPTNVTLGNIEAHSVDVSWTPNGEETQWTVLYGEPGFNPDTEGSSLTVNTTPETTLEDLEPETDYAVYVRAFCDEDSHSSWTGSVSFTTEDLGVEAHQTQFLKIYPNPTTGMLNLQSEIGLESYKLYDLRGRIIQQGGLENNQIDVLGIENGLYILRVQDQNGGVQNLKVVKE